MKHKISKKTFNDFVYSLKDKRRSYYYINTQLDRLQKAGFNLSTKLNNGDSLLHFAVKKDEIRLIKILVKYGIIIDLADLKGLTPLHLAVKDNKYNAAKTLLEAKANPNLGAELDQTPLHLAVINGNVEMLELLRQYGADCFLVDEKNQDAIDYAIDEKELPVIKYFYETVELDQMRREKLEKIMEGEKI
ncbi:MAG TPA: ankyrin repeat domain-containing protein [Acholeplasma sp.]|nr:ankyrin repeat domain-containing protein [Acholeplasma sp.]